MVARPPRQPHPSTVRPLSAPSLIGLWLVVMLGMAACSNEETPSQRSSEPDSALDTASPTPDTAPLPIDTAEPRDTTPAPDTMDTVPETPDAEPDTVEPPFPEPCNSAEERCLSDMENAYCQGGRWLLERCQPRFRCFEGDGCERLVCEPGEPAGCSGQGVLAVCNEEGTDVVLEPCPDGLSCRFVNDVGGFRCTDTICDPGRIRCRNDARGQEVCSANGQQWEAGVACLEEERCEDGACLSLCETNSKVSSFLGCEYWSVDLDNIGGSQNAAHAVILSNPSPARAQVEVFDALGQPVEVEGWPTSVEPGELAVWPFEPSAVNLQTDEPLLSGDRIDGSVIARESFRFVTNVPVTAHQFNPLAGEGVFTNDASLLLPSNAIGTEYLAMSWRHRFERFGSLRGAITVVAVDPEPTTVEVVPTETTIEGRDLNGNRNMTRIFAGTSRTWVLEQGEVLNLETAGPDGRDLTGTSIVADRPVVVFGGHECANVRLGINYCDHIETQLAPIATWGTVHVATKFSPRGAEPDIYRVLAATDGTTLSTTPSVPEVDGASLNRGEFLEFELFEPVLVVASSPVSVGHYMVGSNNNGIPLACGGTGIGDPAMTILPPVQQFRDNYIILTPSGYAEDYVNVIAQQGALVELDGVALMPEQFVPLGDTGYLVAVVPVSAGPHTLTGSTPFGLEVYGYNCD
ncbi:MAG: IgGFc-binding protein, partial [Myxococcota bacterium]